MMAYGTYLRVETNAGGTFASKRALLRAFRAMLTDEGKSRKRRGIRHKAMRELIEYQKRAQDLCYRFRM